MKQLKLNLHFLLEERNTIRLIKIKVSSSINSNKENLENEEIIEFWTKSITKCGLWHCAKMVKESFHIQIYTKREISSKQVGVKNLAKLMRTIMCNYLRIQEMLKIRLIVIINYYLVIYCPKITTTTFMHFMIDTIWNMGKNT